MPFALGVALLGIAVGFVAAQATRDGAQAELANRAKTAERVFAEALLRQQAELESEASRQAAVPRLARALERPGGGRLARLGFPRTLSNRFDLVAVAGPHGDHVYSSRGADWRPLTGRAGLYRRVARGIHEGGLAVTPDGTPVLYAAVPMRVDSPRSGMLVVAETIRPVALEEIARPLDLSLELVTSRGARVSSLGGVRDPRGHVRAYRYPLPVAAPSAGTAHLEVGLSLAPLDRAIGSAALEAAVVALVVALVLLALGAALLDRAVVRPLAALRTAIRQVRTGAYDIRLPAQGTRELAELSEGFNRMAAMVGEQQARLEAQARTDSLTGLSNHARFHAALAETAERARHTQEALAVVVMDVDRFKALNDEHGHLQGDRVLRAIGARLSDLTRADDIAARLGGDEFALLLRGAGPDAAVAVAERLREASADIVIPGGRVTTSVGVACFPGDVEDPAVLMESADEALYAAKRGGRARTRRYDRGAAENEAAERGEVAALLATPGTLSAAYQPVVALDSGEIVGYEALARFPGASHRRPDQWFAQAYRAGLGPELEAQAVAAALAAPGRPAGTFIALNVTPSGLSAPPVLAALPPRLDGIVVEMTEQELVTDADALGSALAALRARGARIALDDVGAGYAGLQQVMRVEPDIVKLDRSLVAGVDADPARMALIEAFVGFARRTGIEVFAEGIETPAELATLAELGVIRGQGYLLARPGPPWPALAAPPLPATGAPAAAPPAAAGLARL